MLEDQILAHFKGRAVYAKVLLKRKCQFDFLDRMDLMYYRPIWRSLERFMG